MAKRTSKKSTPVRVIEQDFAQSLMSLPGREENESRVPPHLRATRRATRVVLSDEERRARQQDVVEADRRMKAEREALTAQLRVQTLIDAFDREIAEIAPAAERAKAALLDRIATAKAERDGVKARFDAEVERVVRERERTHAAAREALNAQISSVSGAARQKLRQKFTLLETEQSAQLADLRKKMATWAIVAAKPVRAQLDARITDLEAQYRDAVSPAGKKAVREAIKQKEAERDQAVSALRAAQRAEQQAKIAPVVSAGPKTVPAPEGIDAKEIAEREKRIIARATPILDEIEGIKELSARDQLETKAEVEKLEKQSQAVRGSQPRDIAARRQIRASIEEQKEQLAARLENAKQAIEKKQARVTGFYAPLDAYVDSAIEKAQKGIEEYAAAQDAKISALSKQLPRLAQSIPLGKKAPAKEVAKYRAAYEERERLIAERDATVSRISSELNAWVGAWKDKKLQRFYRIRKELAYTPRTFASIPAVEAQRSLLPVFGTPDPEEAAAIKAREGKEVDLVGLQARIRAQAAQVKPGRFDRPPKTKLRLERRTPDGKLVTVTTTVAEEVSRLEKIINDSEAQNIAVLQRLLEQVQSDLRRKRLKESTANSRIAEVQRLIDGVRLQAVQERLRLEGWWKEKVAKPEDNVYVSYPLSVSAIPTPEWDLSVRRRKELQKEVAGGATAAQARAAVKAREEEAAQLTKKIQELPGIEAALDAESAETGKLIRETAENADAVYASDIDALNNQYSAGDITADELKSDMIVARRVRDRKKEIYNDLVQTALRFREIIFEKSLERAGGRPVRPLRTGPVSDAEIALTDKRVEREAYDPFRKVFYVRKAEAQKTTAAARALTERIYYKDDETGEIRYNVVPLTDTEGNEVFPGVAYRYTGKLYGGKLPSFYIMRARRSLPDAYIRAARAEQAAVSDVGDIQKARALFAKLVYDYNDYPESARRAAFSQTRATVEGPRLARMDPKQEIEVAAQTFKSRNAAYDEGRIRYFMERWGFQLPDWTKIKVKKARAPGTFGPDDKGRPADRLWSFFVNRNLFIPGDAWVKEYGKRPAGPTKIEKRIKMRRSSRKAAFKPKTSYKKQR